MQYFWQFATHFFVTKNIANNCAIFITLEILPHFGFPSVRIVKSNVSSVGPSSFVFLSEEGPPKLFIFRFVRESLFNLKREGYIRSLSAF